MLLIAKSRNLELREVLQYSLRPFPLSLATLEGNLVKSTKSKLLSIIESEVQHALVENVNDENALIIDAMALLQSMKIKSTTFGELAFEVLTRIVQMASFSNSKRADLVSDRYPDHSIKNFERKKRSQGSVLSVKIYSGQQKIPCQWKKFLAVGKNKEEIMDFLFNAWSTSDVLDLQGIELFTTHKEQCHRLFESQEGIICSEVTELKSNHEEADTRMLCHALHASMNYPSVIIKSPDTDVFFISLNASSVIPSKIYFETGNQDNMRIISLDEVKLYYGPQWCSAFVGLHSFTGMCLERMPFTKMFSGYH